MWETDTVHPPKLNCNTSNSKMDCDLHSSTPTLSLQINFWTSSPSMPADPRSYQPQPSITVRPADEVHLPTANTCISRLYLPMIHQSNYSELNFCSQSPPRCLCLCRSLSHGLSQMTAMYLHVCCWLRCHLFDH